MKSIAIAWALGLGLGFAAPAWASDWLLVGADDNAVASLWTVKQARTTSPQVELEDHVEFEETDNAPAHGVGRFSLYDCAAGTIKRGAPTFYEPGRGDEIEAYGMQADWDTAPRKPAAGSYDERLLQFACALDRDDPALARIPRLPHPFTRADANAARAKDDPDRKPTVPRWQGLAVADPDAGEFGITAVWHQPTREAAEAELERQCTRNGWSNCDTTVSRQCVAVAYIERNLVYFSGNGATEADAKRAAYAECSKQGYRCDNDMASCP